MGINLGSVFSSLKLRIASTRYLTGTLITIGLLVWYGGPYIVAGAEKPLEAVSTRLLIACMLVILWFALTRSGRVGGTNRSDIATQLRARAVQLRMFSFLTLLGILCALIGGIYVFQGAEQSTVDAELSLLENVMEQKATYERDIVAADFSIDRLSKNPAANGLSSNAATLPNETEVAKAFAAAQPRNQTTLEALQRLIELKCTEILDELACWRARKKASESKLADLTAILKKRIDRDDGNGFTMYLVSSLGTKIGSAAILFFMVQVLINLYRYNVRLAAFYDSRADILELAGTSDQRMSLLLKVLSVDGFDFGNTPATPVQSVVELSKDVLSAKRS